MEIICKDNTVFRDVTEGVTWCDWIDCKHYEYGLCTLEEKVIGKEGCANYERTT